MDIKPSNYNDERRESPLNGGFPIYSLQDVENKVIKVIDG